MLLFLHACGFFRDSFYSGFLESLTRTLRMLRKYGKEKGTGDGECGLRPLHLDEVDGREHGGQQRTPWRPNPIDNGPRAIDNMQSVN